MSDAWASFSSSAPKSGAGAAQTGGSGDGNWAEFGGFASGGGAPQAQGGAGGGGGDWAAFSGPPGQGQPGQPAAVPKLGGPPGRTATKRTSVRGAQQQPQMTQVPPVSQQNLTPEQQKALQQRKAMEQQKLMQQKHQLLLQQQQQQQRQSPQTNKQHTQQGTSPAQPAKTPQKQQKPRAQPVQEPSDPFGASAPAGGMPAPSGDDMFANFAGAPAPTAAQKAPAPAAGDDEFGGFADFAGAQPATAGGAAAPAAGGFGAFGDFGSAPTGTHTAAAAPTSSDPGPFASFETMTPVSSTPQSASVAPGNEFDMFAAAPATESKAPQAEADVGGFQQAVAPPASQPQPQAAPASDPRASVEIAQLKEKVSAADREKTRLEKEQEELRRKADELRAQIGEQEAAAARQQQLYEETQARHATELEAMRQAGHEALVKIVEEYQMLAKAAVAQEREHAEKQLANAVQQVTDEAQQRLEQQHERLQAMMTEEVSARVIKLHGAKASTLLLDYTPSFGWRQWQWLCSCQGHEKHLLLVQQMCVWGGGRGGGVRRERMYVYAYLHY